MLQRYRAISPHQHHLQDHSSPWLHFQSTQPCANGPNQCLHLCRTLGPANKVGHPRSPEAAAPQWLAKTKRHPSAVVKWLTRPSQDANRPQDVRHPNQCCQHVNHPSNLSSSSSRLNAFLVHHWTCRFLYDNIHHPVHMHVQTLQKRSYGVATLHRNTPDDSAARDKILKVYLVFNYFCKIKWYFILCLS